MVSEKSRSESAWEKAKRERMERTFVSQGYSGQRVFSIPSDYPYVGKDALKDCPALEKLVIPGTVREVEDGAFENCVNLREVILEEGIEILGWYLFAGCENLHCITAPDSIQHITPHPFKKIPNLKAPVLNASGTEYIYYPPGLGETRVTIPHGVRIIHKDAFNNYSALEEVILPNTLERIEWTAFRGTSLKSLTLPESIQFVSSYAFSYCLRLEQVDIRCDSSAIEPRAFDCCLHLRLPCDSPPQYLEGMRIKGKSPFRLPARLDLPEDGHEADPRFLKCAAGSLMGKQEAMEQLADFFHGKQETGHRFYLLAERFWRLRLYYLGNPKAKQWFFDWITTHPDTQMEVAARPALPGGSGRVLHALGFLFFDPNRSYDVQAPDDIGVVEVTAYAGEDGPDEDGFGGETYYDWWYMTENLAMVPGAGYIHSYSKLDKRNSEEKFEALHDLVAETWKNHPELVEREIQRKIRKDCQKSRLRHWIW